MAFCFVYLNASVLVSERTMKNARLSKENMRLSNHGGKRVQKQVNGCGIENNQEKEYYIM